jgi:hypothetical protein
LWRNIRLIRSCRLPRIVRLSGARSVVVSTKWIMLDQLRIHMPMITTTHMMLMIIIVMRSRRLLPILFVRNTDRLGLGLGQGMQSVDEAEACCIASNETVCSVPDFHILNYYMATLICKYVTCIELSIKASCNIWTLLFCNYSKPSPLEPL